MTVEYNVFAYVRFVIEKFGWEAVDCRDGLKLEDFDLSWIGVEKHGMRASKMKRLGYTEEETEMYAKYVNGKLVEYLKKRRENRPNTRKGEILDEKIFKLLESLTRTDDKKERKIVPSREIYLLYDELIRPRRSRSPKLYQRDLKKALEIRPSPKRRRI